jgi:hypothetical protein
LRAQTSGMPPRFLEQAAHDPGLLHNGLKNILEDLCCRLKRALNTANGPNPSHCSSDDTSVFMQQGRQSPMTSMHVPNRGKTMADDHRAISKGCFCFQKLSDDLRISGNRRNLPLFAPGQKAAPVVGVRSFSTLDGKFCGTNQDSIPLRRSLAGSSEEGTLINYLGPSTQ